MTSDLKALNAIASSLNRQLTLSFDGATWTLRRRGYFWKSFQTADLVRLHLQNWTLGVS